MHVYKLFVSTPIEFPFICWFQWFASLSAHPVSHVWAEAAGWGWVFRCEDSQGHCDCLSGISCLQYMFLVANKGRGNFSFMSVPQFLSHTCGMINFIVWGGAYVEGGQIKYNFLLAVYNPLIWAIKKKMQWHNLILNTSFVILDQWFSMFLHSTIF